MKRIFIRSSGMVKIARNFSHMAKYPSNSITEGDLTKLKKAGMIDNIKKQRTLPPPPCDK